MKTLSKILGMATKTLKVLMINTIVFSLIQTPFVSEAFAAGKNTGGFDAKDILSLADGALGVYANYLGQKQQMLQQQISSVNNQKLIAQLSPTCRKADGTACYTTPAKFFPECTLPASMSNMPVNACNNPTPEINQISSMITYESIAQGWMNYYDQMSNEASNTSYAVGLRCLGDKQKAMDSQLTEMVNSLQRLQDRMNQDKQIFRDNNKKLLEDMNTANDELFGAGGASKNNLKIKTQDFAKFFSHSCQSVIGKDRLNSGTKEGGLNGILQGISSTNKAAADFNLNKNVIEDDVRREAGKITTSINDSGIDDFLGNSNTQSNIKSTSYPTIEATVKKQAAELNTARSRIYKDLAALGYTPPAMDKNFTVDMNDFMAGSADFFKKKYVNDCVTGASSGIAIPVEDILKSLEQKSTNSEGTARNDYRAALKRILDSDAMMDDKMASIKDLQTKYPDITITYKDSSQARVTESPYDLFMKTIDKCSQRFSQDDQFSSKGSNGVSYQKKVERGRAALQELKNLNDSFSSKITQAITDQVLNCNGQAVKSGSEFCNEESLKPTSDNFCVAHASVCANDIQGCYAEANNQVQVRKTKMENLAKTFNANVAAMITRSNALYEQQKAAVTNITQLIQSKFPGTNFEIPKDMFVSMPELKKDAYGVEMAGDGDIKSFLDGENSMPGKIDKLKQVFQKQRDAVKKATDDYIALQKAAMEKERGRWEKLAGDCKGAVDKSQSELAKANNEGLKKQGEEDAKVAKFCKKYNSIGQNPVGGCGQAKDLADLSDEISTRISGQAESVTQQYANACDGYMNQSDSLSSLPSNCDDLTGSDKTACKKAKDKYAKSDDSGSSPAKASKKLNIAALCGSGSDSKSNADFISNIAGKLSSDDKQKLSDAKTFTDALNKADSDSDPIDDAGFFDNIDNLIKNTSKDKTKICDRIQDAITPDSSYDDSLQDTLIDAQLKLVSDPAKKEDALKEIKTLKIAKNAYSAKLEKAKELQNALDDLAQIKKPAQLTGKAQQTDNISKIGEQMTGPCDMQSTSNITKNIGFDLNSFDSGVLGSASRGR
ncbi:MAG: hypothetical protein PHY93_11965 [Bacteriovorax sp.]|nr:hypothetical protein [Bacteriovorax sp.]